MSILKFPLLYVGSKGEKNLYTLFDCGANLSCVNPEFVKDIADPVHLGRIRKLSTATLQKWRIKLDFEHDKVVVDPKVAKLQLI